MQIEKSGLADAFAVSVYRWCAKSIFNPAQLYCELMWPPPLVSKKLNNNSSIPRNNNEHHQI